MADDFDTDSVHETDSFEGIYGSLLPHPATFTLCEFDSKLIHTDGTLDRAVGTLKIPQYPVLQVPPDPSLITPDDGGSSLPSSVFAGSPGSRINHAYEAAEQEQQGLIPRIWDAVTHMSLPFPKRHIISYSELDQIETEIAAMGWHCHLPLLAVASKKNKIFLFDLSEKAWVPLVLEHALQTDITCLEWRPMAGKTLAVGCAKGVCIWSVDTMKALQALSNRMNGAASSESPVPLMNILNFPSQPAVITLSWSPNGQFLATGSLNDSAVVVWDVALETAIPLRRGLAGLLVVSWSPSGSHLCSTHTSGEVRIWETKTWTCQVWRRFGGPSKTLAWSPTGKYLLVAAQYTNQLHCLEMGKTPSQQSKLLRTQDVGGSEIAAGGASIRLGGPVSNVAWDPSGDRMVVAFSGRAEGAELLALYSVKQSPVVMFSLRGYIRGPLAENETPKAAYLQFAKTYREGALLTAAWSDSRVSFVPLIFKSEKELEESGVVNVSWEK